MLAQRPHVILFGPPGAGKSTQAQKLVRDWPLDAISTGKKLREEIAAKTELGQKIAECLARGELVDDELMIATIERWLRALPDERGFLLDGFPRTIAQAEALDEILAAAARPLTAVIKLSLSVSEAIYRLGGRRSCYGSWPEEIIHINDEEAVSRCLAKGGLLVQRPDDLPNVIVNRLSVYEAETEPLISYYREREILHSIDASGAAESVCKRIIKALQASS
jgi:adenylate kinase